MLSSLSSFSFKKTKHTGNKFGESIKERFWASIFTSGTKERLCNNFIKVRNVLSCNALSFSNAFFKISICLSFSLFPNFKKFKKRNQFQKFIFLQTTNLQVKKLILLAIILESNHERIVWSKLQALLDLVPFQNQLFHLTKHKKANFKNFIHQFPIKRKIKPLSIWACAWFKTFKAGVTRNNPSAPLKCDKIWSDPFANKTGTVNWGESLDCNSITLSREHPNTFPLASPTVPTNESTSIICFKKSLWKVF